MKASALRQRAPFVSAALAVMLAPLAAAAQDPAVAEDLAGGESTVVPGPGGEAETTVPTEADAAAPRLAATTGASAVAGPPVSAQVPAPTPAQVSAPTPAQAPVLPSARAPAVEPQRLSVGQQGYFQPGILLQGWALLTHTPKLDEPTALTFRLRRMQLKAKGEIIPQRVRYALMVDPAKAMRFGSATVPVENQDPAPSDPEAPEQVTVSTPPADRSILQDAYATFVTPYVDVTVGQYRIPVSLAGLGSTTALPLPEDPLVARTFGGRSRDLGIKLDKRFAHFRYDVGLYNGQGANQIDGNLQKDLGIRLEVYPIEGLMLGAVGYVGLGERDEPRTKDRVEGDVALEVADTSLQLEYIHAWDGAEGARTEGHGGYALLGHTFAEKFQPVARVGFIDTDVRESDTITRHYELGLNYFVLANEVKLQAAYGLFSSDVDDDLLRHELTLVTQLAF